MSNQVEDYFYSLISIFYVHFYIIYYTDYVYNIILMIFIKDIYYIKQVLKNQEETMNYQEKNELFIDYGN